VGTILKSNYVLIKGPAPTTCIFSRVNGASVAIGAAEMIIEPANLQGLSLALRVRPTSFAFSGSIFSKIDGSLNPFEERMFAGPAGSSNNALCLGSYDSSALLIGGYHSGELPAEAPIDLTTAPVGTNWQSITPTITHPSPATIETPVVLEDMQMEINRESEADSDFLVLLQRL
jgi:hypothetical protein